MYKRYLFAIFVSWLFSPLFASITQQQINYQPKFYEGQHIRQTHSIGHIYSTVYYPGENVKNYYSTTADILNSRRVAVWNSNKQTQASQRKLLGSTNNDDSNIWSTPSSWSDPYYDSSNDGGWSTPSSWQDPYWGSNSEDEADWTIPSSWQDPYWNPHSEEEQDWTIPQSWDDPFYNEEYTMTPVGELPTIFMLLCVLLYATCKYIKLKKKHIEA